MDRGYRDFGVDGYVSLPDLNATRSIRNSRTPSDVRLQLPRVNTTPQPLNGPTGHQTSPTGSRISVGRGDRSRSPHKNHSQPRNLDKRHRDRRQNNNQNGWHPSNRHNSNHREHREHRPRQGDDERKRKGRRFVERTAMAGAGVQTTAIGVAAVGAATLANGGAAATGAGAAAAATSTAVGTGAAAGGAAAATGGLGAAAVTAAKLVGVFLVLGTVSTLATLTIVGEINRNANSTQSPPSIFTTWAPEDMTSSKCVETNQKNLTTPADINCEGTLGNTTHYYRASGIHKCTQYFSCVNGTVVDYQNCTPGYVYHPETCECVKELRGYYKDPTDCGAFYRCDNVAVHDDMTSTTRTKKIFCKEGTSLKLVDEASSNVVCVPLNQTTCTQSNNRCMSDRRLIC